MHEALKNTKSCTVFRRHVAVVSAPEQKDVRFWPVEIVVLPPWRHLDTKTSPLVLAQQLVDAVLAQNLVWYVHMSVFVNVVIVLARVEEAV